MNSMNSNYSIRDEIRDFWSERAATFDESVGHEIFSEEERKGWQRLIRKHLGDGTGRAALDLACGTAVISHLMNDVGFKVTGLDWSDAMLGQARAKAKKRGADIRFVSGDAENTMEPKNSYDVITNRHLVWTLVDPPAAFAEWFSVLKPGGKVLILDGNMGKETWVKGLQKLWSRVTGKPAASHMTPAMAARHQNIRSRVYFSDAMPAEAVVDLLTKAGFVNIVVDRKLSDIHWAQARKMPFLRGLERMVQERFAICATKPE
ncbi:class I SAM-dependent methyltransferase [Neorhizobium galegae]|uniref:Methyltransferase domain-containing protein n=2 Tax=Neorhizobium galegae TaxID=399 RepID=A0A6A1TKI3_NEOGA|nr:methyltransferase domain-containing protein [Neorhizobium galegae]KAB1083386.1 methyltransferase domain-containing protein [Neorhizobium galegae]MBP2561279.1 ubiquinone/menaquinone biosynthesis C-methylase UbiE [Neorhizobium galegae]MCQ1851469.1 class I SAM-dependent methyltransferase [Neorhizobium galegae]MDQ0134277.1 ubiquinone/menaquinone biosynthesis C-methylase UbiE [Neorhizobium galegae]CDN50823.1 Putative methyl-transferase, S-Adenosyl-L-methionine (SAM)-MTase protein [Neorhizobium g